MHPVRIPREYWRHRIKLAKAMGLNAVSFCVFWNAHEEHEGKFDFKSGELDIGEYLKIAKEEGLWVFLRPGPYVCSEWDLGGLPWWLLRAPDIKLRCSDPHFTGPVEHYFHELAKVIRPHMAANGGSILLVQIENEYGSYPRRDHDYIVWLRDQWVKEDIKGPFITADGADEHYLKGVTIPGAAVGLDSGENEAQFALARKMNPGVPVMSSETYPGWLRHWGESWWQPNDISELLKFYMETRKSFNLYMFHGGTNFGFHAGANGNENDLTSYDYAAPVNEQGCPTPAYDAYRRQLASYLPAGQRLPDVPAVISTMEIPPISMERWSGLWDQLPNPIVSEQPQCFETLGQNQGLVLYRTRIPAGASGKLSAPMHGYSTIYLEGVLTQNLEIPAREKETTLEVLVQAMGHINFLIEMDADRKGLLGPVKVGDTVLKDWEMFCFPLKSDWVISMPKTSPAPGRIGGIFKGEFNLDTLADIYLDMSNYKKGMLWVNGRNLGYHWSARGPQYRLYCPGPWLKKGVNTIVVLDTELTEPQTVACARTAH
jgi:beta-galactosidase